MRYRSVQITMLFALALAGIPLAGCSDSDNNPTAPGIQPEIVNIVDSFEYQVQSIASFTGQATYSWQNSGTVAAIDHSSVVSGGTGTLTVRDDAGTEVYSGPLSDSGSLVSAVGTSGTWTVVVAYVDFSGTVNFRVQKG